MQTKESYKSLIIICKSENNEGISRVIGDMKDHSSFYKRNLITQEKWAFGGLEFGEIALGSSTWHRREDHSFGEARSDLIFNCWSQWIAIVSVYLDISLNNQSLIEPTHFHACIMNFLKLFFIFLGYMLCSYVLNKLNYLSLVLVLMLLNVCCILFHKLLLSYELICKVIKEYFLALM